jgi:hypothetical protein
MAPLSKEALETELQKFGPRSITARLCTTLLNALPDAPDAGSWTDLAGCLEATAPGSSLLNRVHTLAEEPAVGRALFAAKAIDTGDTGITILTGVRSALSLFLGDKGPGAGADAQQAADAALKALGIAYLASQLIPRPPAQRVAILASLPAGQALVRTYAAIEVALPFGAAVVQANGTHVATLVETQSRKVAGKLLGVIGRQGVDDAQETLAELLSWMDQAALEIAPDGDELSKTLGNVLPGRLTAHTEALSDLVAAGADALPLYRYLCARLAAETRVALARYETDPSLEPTGPPAPAPEAVPTQPAPTPAPPVLPEALAAVALGTDGTPDASVHDLAGVFQRAMPWGEVWLVFTHEGLFADYPPADPDPDWMTLSEAGHQVGTYQHRGGTLTIRWPNGRETTSALQREQTQLTIDSERCLRCDWNLEGHTLHGSWRGRGGEASWTFRDDGHFVSHRGEGRYTLGTGSVALAFADGSTQALSLYSTLEPNSACPETLWVGGIACDLC